MTGNLFVWTSLTPLLSMILLVIAGDITVMQAYIIMYQQTSSLSMQVNSSTTVVATRMDQVKAAMIEENMVYL